MCINALNFHAVRRNTGKVLDMKAVGVGLTVVTVLRQVLVGFETTYIEMFAPPTKEKK